MKVLLIIVGVVAILIFGLFVAPFFVPTSSIENKVIKGIEEVFDGTASIESFRFKIVPYPAFIIDGLTVISKEGEFMGRPVMQAGQVQVGLSPKAFIRGKIIADVTIDNIFLDIRMAESGAANVRVPPTNLRSLTIRNGEMKFTGRAGTKPFQIKQFAAVATDINNIDDVVSANLRIAEISKTKGSSSFDVSGAFSLNQKTKTIQARGVNLIWGGARFNIDLLYGLDSAPFDLHAATSAVDIKNIFNLFPSFAAQLPASFEMSGQIGFDVSLKGTKENASIKLHADAGQSKINWGKLLSKEKGLPLKFIFNGNLQPAYITFDDASLSFGEDSFKLSGFLKREAAYPAQIKATTVSLKDERTVGCFPFLSFFEKPQGAILNFEITGGLFDDVARVVSGQYSFDEGVFGDYAISKFVADFQYQGGKLNLNPLKAELFGAALSGSGSLDFSNVPTFLSESVIDNIDATKIFGQDLNGMGSLVVKVSSMGADQMQMKDNLQLEGTLIMPFGDIPSLNIGGCLLTDGLWKLFEPYVPGGFPPETLKELSAITGSVQNLKMSFTSKDGEFSVSKMQWAGKDYDAEVVFTVSSYGMLAGDGNLFLSKEKTAQLIKDQTVRKNIAVTDERLKIPLTVEGTLLTMIVKPNSEKLIGELGSIKMQLPAEEKKLVKEILKEKVASPAEQPKQQITEEKKVVPRQRPAAKAPPSRMTTDVDEEVFKVFVGE